MRARVYFAGGTVEGQALMSKSHVSATHCSTVQRTLMPDPMSMCLKSVVCVRDMTR